MAPVITDTETGNSGENWKPRGYSCCQVGTRKREPLGKSSSWKGVRRELPGTWASLVLNQAQLLVLVTVHL